MNIRTNDHHAPAAVAPETDRHSTGPHDEYAGRTVGGDRRDPSGPNHGRAASTAERVRQVLASTWADWRIGVGATLAVVGSWAFLAGSWTPRGPVTGGQAVWSMLISFAVGYVAGIVTTSRWALVVAPSVFAMVFEFARAGTDGPTVDGLHFTQYGILALVVGRGLHALTALLPMALGAVGGAGTARRLAGTAASGGAAGRSTRRTVAVLMTLAMVAFGVAVSRPASTDPIVDASGNEVPGSIAELTTVSIGGHDLALMIRGHRLDNPVLLFLAGGPGGSEMGSMRNHLAELEEHFTVVTWDQRGTGKSYPALDPVDTISLDGYVADTIAVTDYLRDRFGRERIVLLGQSWGTILGVLTVQERPDLYQAFVGTGQMVSPRETDRQFYEDAIAWARDNGDHGLVNKLTDIGPPPYDDILNYETALSYEQEVYPYDHTVNAEGEGQMSENLIADEYTLIDEFHVLAGFLDTFAALYPQIQEIDLRNSATDFDVPVFFVQGAHEADGRAVLFDEWYPMVTAPSKGLVVLETSGHRPLFEQPVEFVDYMRDVVLVEMQSGS